MLPVEDEERRPVGSRCKVPHVTVEDLRKLVLLEGGATDPRVVEHLVSGCSECSQLIRRELIESGRLKPESGMWHASDREIEVFVTDLPSAPIEIITHLREGCGYCLERARRAYREHFGALPGRDRLPATDATPRRET